jgi:hypothetical protein
MSSPLIQAQANALNAKLEGEASKVLDDMERNWMRKVARESFACAVRCYDKAGKSGPSEALEQCARNCQVPYQQSNALLQQVRNSYTFFKGSAREDVWDWINVENSAGRLAYSTHRLNTMITHLDLAFACMVMPPIDH